MNIYHEFEKILQKETKHKIHLFISINDDYEENKIFYDILKKISKIYSP